MYLFLILILILVNGLFVLAEMSLVSARKARLQAAADKGDKASQTAIRLIEHPNRYLSTTQIGITLATIVLGMYGEASLTEDLTDMFKRWSGEQAWVVRHSHAVATGVTVVLLTLATLLLAELIPKRLGQMRAEGFARLVARPMDLLSRIATPLVAVLSGITNLFLRLVPVREKRDDQSAQEEVKAILASGAEEGLVHQAEQQLVERVFQLGDRRVKALMVPRNDIDFLEAEDTLQRVRVVVATSSHSYFPVCEGDLDHLVGVVHVKDLVKHGLISDEINLRALARRPMFVPESATALKVLEQFKRMSSHFAFVLDEYGVLVGLVTLNDLVESMLGDIPMPGEAGTTDPMIVKRADGSYLLDAMLTVGELKLLMGVENLPKQDAADFDTLGGFVIAYLGRIPATGDRFEFDRFGFEVVDMDRTRVDKVLLTIMPPAETAGNSERAE